MQLLSRLLWSLPLLCPFVSQAVVINGYAEITAISGSVLTVGTVDEVGAQFTTGKSIVLMQMQDDVIGTNTNNDADFGNIADLKQAGKFVVRTITGVTRDGSNMLTSITLNSVPDGAFNIGTNGSVQAITYELLGGGGNFTTTADITALDWNGSIGGVVAIRVGGSLTLRHSISADGAGFRGGTRTTGGGSSCDATTYITSSSATAYAGKGEGIHKLANTAWANGRGKVANGGGGGNSHNAGGAGGGGYTAGGDGGLGYGCGTGAGGIGGLALGASVAGDRIFMGGGAGGGEGNNSVSTAGGRGGGIVLIKAGSIVTSGTYANLRISADGVNGATTGGNDGAGGGGAGGSVMLQVPTYAVSSTSPLTIHSNGGGGGTVTDAAAHGGGGGGGQGAVIYSIPLPTTNITTQTNSGAAGCSNNSVPCNTPASVGGGTAGNGIVVGSGTVLPIELLSFDAVPKGDRVELFWATASESDNALFTVERSVDLDAWATVARVPGAIHSTAVLNYAAEDLAPEMGLAYYRLKQTDLDGTSTLSDLVPVRMHEGAQLNAYPNPASATLELRWSVSGAGRVDVVNGLGQHTGVSAIVRNGRCTVDVSTLPSGSYVALLISEGSVVQERFLVRR